MIMLLMPYMHLGFNCKNLDESVEFYKKFFGCKEKFSLFYGDMIPNNKEHQSNLEPEFLKFLQVHKDIRWIVYLEWNNGVFIELFNEISAKIPHIPQQSRDLNYTHFSMLTDDIEEFYQQFLEKGGREYVDLSPRPNVDRTYAFWFHDPDGNKVEVIQYTEYSMQIIGRTLPPGKENILEEMMENYNRIERPIR
jgi:catechol 2,3-dioxygenase-like lactoylglutathione lyase family enzyme